MTVKRLLLLLLLLLPFHAEAARLFTAANSDKVLPSEGLIQTGGWSFSAWIKFASLPAVSGQYVIFSDAGGTNRWNPLIYYENAAGTKHVRTITSSVFSSFHISDFDINFNIGQWYHLALVNGTQAGSDVYKIYINGVSQTWTAGGTYVGESNHGGAIAIGAGTLDAGATFGYFDGTIGEVARWVTTDSSKTACVLTDGEVLALARGAPPEKVHFLPPSGTPRQYVWRLEGWSSADPDIGSRHTAPATVTGTARADGPPVLPR